MARLLVLLWWLAAAAARDAAAADSFWLPLPDGAVFSFLVSGQVDKSSGQSQSFGPALEQIGYQAVDRQVLDHHADRLGTDGVFLQRTPAGWFRVAEGDPTQDPTYEYLVDPQPFLLEAAFEVGEQRSFSGARRGVWEVPGGAYESWSGGWTSTYTHLGHASLTTPLGHFEHAALLQRQSTTEETERSLFPGAVSRGVWTEVWWFVPGRGLLQIQGSGRFESDFDGDGRFEYWSQESQLMVAVPEPAPALLLAAGLLLLAGRRRRSGIMAACPPSATRPR